MLKASVYICVGGSKVTKRLLICWDQMSGGRWYCQRLKSNGRQEDETDHIIGVGNDQDAAFVDFKKQYLALIMRI